MRRAAIATTSTVAGVVLLLSLKPHHSTVPVLPVAQPGKAPTPAPAASGGTAGSGGSATGPGGSSGSGARKGTAGSGTFTGPTVETPYGPVQVAVTLSHRRITSVKALQTPSDAARSQEIAAYAVPRLTQETLGAQSAQIDAVSGASYTSAGYIQSLQSALDKAGA